MTIRLACGCLIAGLAALAACNGWPPATDLEQAQHKPEHYPTYATTPAEQVQTLNFANRRWLVSPAPVSIRGIALQPVGTAGQTTIYAEPGEAAPYGVLYAAGADGRFHQVLPID